MSSPLLSPTGDGVAPPPKSFVPPHLKNRSLVYATVSRKDSVAANDSNASHRSQQSQPAASPPDTHHSKQPEPLASILSSAIGHAPSYDTTKKASVHAAASELPYRASIAPPPRSTHLPHLDSAAKHPSISIDQQPQATTTKAGAIARFNVPTMADRKFLPPHLRPRKVIPPHLRNKPVTIANSSVENCDKATQVGAKVTDLGPIAASGTAATTFITTKTNPNNRQPVKEAASTRFYYPDSAPSDKLLYMGRRRGLDNDTRGGGGGSGGDRPCGRGKGAPRNTRGRGRSWGRGYNNAAGGLRGRDQWLRNRDIPKPDPDRWKPDWAGIHNEPYKGGWADAPNSEGAGERALQDFYAPLPPDPITWDFRPAFREHQNEDQVQQWLDCMENLMTHVNRQPDLDDVPVVDGFTFTFRSKDQPIPGTDYKTMGEVIPPYWIPDRIARAEPQAFWDDYLRSFPAPVDMGDLGSRKPWWQTIVKDGHFLAPIAQPVIIGIDPDESTDNKIKRESDFGSAAHAENRKRYELAKLGLREQRLIRRAQREIKRNARKEANGGVTPEELQRIRLNHTGKVFIRHVEPTDIPKVRDLYNTYVEFTCAVKETERVEDKEFDDRRKRLDARGLPFLVACVRGGPLEGYYGEEVDQYDEDTIILPDKVIGFAYAECVGDNNNHQNDMLRFTAEMAVYVHQDHLMKGVGNCLVDKMLSILDPEYIDRGGYEVADEDLEVMKRKPCIKNILLHFYHNHPARLEWVSRWLTARLGFKKCGYLEGIGSKLGKEVHLAIFQRSTGVVLDHENLPM